MECCDKKRLRITKEHRVIVKCSSCGLVHGSYPLSLYSSIKAEAMKIEGERT